jgi:hypothetical protein
MSRALVPLIAASLLVLSLAMAGCVIYPPISPAGAWHQYGSLREILYHVDHYYGKLREHRTSFRNSARSFNDLTLYCDYLIALFHQAQQGRVTRGEEFNHFASRAVQVVRLIRLNARGLADDKDTVPGLIDELGRRIEELKKRA